MTEIEEKALALMNEICAAQGAPRSKVLERDYNRLTEALCRAIEQNEAYKREVSDAVGVWNGRWIGAGDSHSHFMALFSRFILPKPVDPLVEVIEECEDGTYGETKAEYAAKLREALAKRGLKIVETGQ